MSCSLWDWKPICDSRSCCGDCDYCGYDDDYPEDDDLEDELKCDLYDAIKIIDYVKSKALNKGYNEEGWYISRLTRITDAIRYAIRKIPKKSETVTVHMEDIG